MNQELVRVALAKAGFKGREEPALTAKSKSELMLVSGVPLLPYFAEVVVRLDLLDVARLYADWVLGFDGNPKNRTNRIRAGLDDAWTQADLVEGEAQFSDPARTNFEVLTRRSGGEWTLRMRHWGPMSRETQVSDRKDRAVQRVYVHWDNMVRLQERPDGLLVQHAIQVTYPPGRDRFKPFPGCPRALRRLLSAADVVRPDLSKPVTRVENEDMAAFVGQILLDEARTVPYVVMAHGKGEDGLYRLPLCPETLSDKLYGIAQVVVLPEPQPRETFTAELVKRGYPKELGVFDGGLRLYLPGMGKDDYLDDHRLWTKFFFERHSAETAMNLLLPQVGSLIAAFMIPSGFFDGIKSLDLRREADLATRDAGGAVQGMVEVSAEELADLRFWNQSFSQENERLVEENRRLVEDNRRLENDFDAKKFQVEELEYRLAKATSTRVDPRDEGEGREERVKEVLSGEPSLDEALLFLQESFPRRLLVLQTALDSAREAASFRHRGRAFGLMKLLVTDYWEMLAGGKGDTEARGVLGNGYAANEASKGSSNEIAVRQRTFLYEGEWVFMGKHLRIGVKDSVAECWRCHFHWDGARKLLVIGHCGRHLDFG